MKLLCWIDSMDAGLGNAQICTKMLKYVNFDPNAQKK